MLSQQEAAMVTILDEVQISVDCHTKPRITLWLVVYGSPIDPTVVNYWQVFVDGIAAKAAEQGWVVEYGNDPCDEGSFAIFRDN